MSLMREGSGECFKFSWDEGYWKLFPEFMGFLFFDIDVKPNFQESWENYFFFEKICNMYRFGEIISDPK